MIKAQQLLLAVHFHSYEVRTCGVCGWSETLLYSQHLPAEEVAGEKDRRPWWGPFPIGGRWVLLPPREVLSFRVGSWKSVSLKLIWGSWSLWLYDCILTSKATFCPQLLPCFLLKEKRVHKQNQQPLQCNLHFQGSRACRQGCKTLPKEAWAQ